MNILWKGSPNQDANRKPIDRIVIHWMYGRLASTDATFQKPHGTSAHYGIANATVHQYVNENRVAYHSGSYPMNQRSIGIEHEAHDNYPATEETYKTSGALVKDICKRNNIPIDRQHIIKHSEVVATRCCGSVDIDKIISYAKNANPLPVPPTNMNDKRGEEFDAAHLVLREMGYAPKGSGHEYWFDNPADPHKFSNQIKALIRDAKTNSTPVDVEAIKDLWKEVGRKEGIRQAQEALNKLV